MKNNWLDGPMCVRELKPGVERAGHSLKDHLDYTVEDQFKAVVQGPPVLGLNMVEFVQQQGRNR